MIALHEPLFVAHGVVHQRTARLNVEQPLGRRLARQLCCLVYQDECRVRVLAHIDIGKVHIDGRYALGIAFLLHAAYDLAEAPLGILLLAAVAVDVAHHIDGHVHLLVQLALGELLRQLCGQLISLHDVQAVQLEDYLVAPLSVVVVQVALAQQVVLQHLHMLVEAGRVSLVERTEHGVAQSLELCRLLIVVGIGVSPLGHARRQYQQAGGNMQ